MGADLATLKAMAVSFAAGFEQLQQLQGVLMGLRQEAADARTDSNKARTQVEQLVSQLASAMPNLLGVVANKNGKRPRERSAPPAATVAAAAADGQTPPPPPIATVTVPPPPPPPPSEGSDRQEGVAVEGTNGEGSQGEGGRKSRRTTPIRGMAAVA